MPPSLITFDIFGTVLDWRTGLETACRDAGRPLGAGEFDQIVNAQAALEHGPFQTYTAITIQSLVRILHLPRATAEAVAHSIPTWPFYPDAHLLRRLMQIAPCGTLTNSDIAHGEALQSRLGFRLTAWLTAEQTRLYKPDPAFFHAMAALRGITPGPDWWHVSAYAGYDLNAANALGLTTVFVNRPHARPGPATYSVNSLADLLMLIT